MSDTFQIDDYTITTSLINDNINIDVTDKLLNKKYDCEVNIEFAKYHFSGTLSDFYEIIKNCLSKKSVNSCEIISKYNPKNKSETGTGYVRLNFKHFYYNGNWKHYYIRDKFLEFTIQVDEKIIPESDKLEDLENKFNIEIESMKTLIKKLENNYYDELEELKISIKVQKNIMIHYLT